MPAYYGRNVYGTSGQPLFSGYGSGLTPLTEEELRRRALMTALEGGAPYDLGVPTGEFGLQGRYGVRALPSGQVMSGQVPSPTVGAPQMRAVSPLQQMHPIPPREPTRAAPTVPARTTQAPTQPTSPEEEQAGVMQSVGKALSRIGRELGKPEVRESMARLGMSISKKEPKKWQYQISEQMKERAESEQEKAATQKQSNLYTQYIQQLSTGKAPSGVIGDVWSPLMPPKGLDPALAQQALQSYLQYSRATGRELVSPLVEAQTKAETERIGVTIRQAEKEIEVLEQRLKDAKDPIQRQRLQAELEEIRAGIEATRALATQRAATGMREPLGMSERDRGLGILAAKWISRADPDALYLEAGGSPDWTQVYMGLSPEDRAAFAAEAQQLNLWVGGLEAPTGVPTPEAYGPEVPEGFVPPPATTTLPPAGPELAAPMGALTPEAVLGQAEPTQAPLMAPVGARTVKTDRSTYQEWGAGGSLYRYIVSGPNAGATYVKRRGEPVWRRIQ